MFYAIIGIIVVIALVLIFRDDHDDSYNKKEKSYRQPEQPKASANVQPRQAYPQQRSEAKSAPKAAQPKTGTKSSGPSLKEQILGEIESAIQAAKKDLEEPMSMVREAMDAAKTALDGAMKDAQKGWTPTGGPDIDEQEQPEPEEEEWEDEEEVDLSFLDKLDYSEDLDENTETFDVVGLRYHCTAHDCGKVVGIVKPEPSNVHDPRAQAVIRSDGKLLGYIPRTQLDWYEEFNEENLKCPFVGEIELDRGRAGLIAEIKVIIPVSREYVEEEIQDEL